MHKPTTVLKLLCWIKKHKEKTKKEEKDEKLKTLSFIVILNNFQRLNHTQKRALGNFNFYIFFISSLKKSKTHS